MVEEWSAGIACPAQGGVGDCWERVQQVPDERGVSELAKIVVWELAVDFNSQFHSTGLNSLQHSIDDDAWRYRDCILISKSNASLPLLMNVFPEMHTKEISIIIIIIMGRKSCLKERVSSLNAREGIDLDLACLPISAF